MARSRVGRAFVEHDITTPMNRARLLVALPVLTLALGAQTVVPPLPDRPALAITRYNDAWLPVMGADGYKPVVVSDGAQVTVSGGAKVMLTPSDRYADGFVSIGDVSATDVPVTTDPDIADNMPSIMDTTSEVNGAQLG